jgi:hypothetical protein
MTTFRSHPKIRLGTVIPRLRACQKFLTEPLLFLTSESEEEQILKYGIKLKLRSQNLKQHALATKSDFEAH